MEHLTELGPRKILHIETTLKNTVVGFLGGGRAWYIFLNYVCFSVTRSEAIFYPQKIY